MKHKILFVFVLTILVLTVYSSSVKASMSDYQYLANPYNVWSSCTSTIIKWKVYAYAAETYAWADIAKCDGSTFSKSGTAKIILKSNGKVIAQTAYYVGDSGISMTFNPYGDYGIGGSNAYEVRLYPSDNTAPIISASTDVWTEFATSIEAKKDGVRWTTVSTCYGNTSGSSCGNGRFKKYLADDGSGPWDFYAQKKDGCSITLTDNSSFYDATYNSYNTLWWHVSIPTAGMDVIATYTCISTPTTTQTQTPALTATPTPTKTLISTVTSTITETKIPVLTITRTQTLTSTRTATKIVTKTPTKTATKVITSTPTKIPSRDRLKSDEKLLAGQYLLSSNGVYKLILQNDGNLVVYNKNVAIWASRTVGKGGVKLVMQLDGNLVLYTSNNTPVWASGTNGKGKSYLVMQNDGNLVIYLLSGTPIWDIRSKILNVKYADQVYFQKNIQDTNPKWYSSVWYMCGSSSVLMTLNYFGKDTISTEGMKRAGLGVLIDPTVGAGRQASWSKIQTYLSTYGVSSTFSNNGKTVLTYAKIKEYIDAGKPIIVGVSFTKPNSQIVGHLATVVGYIAPDIIVVNDPYGSKIVYKSWSTFGNKNGYYWENINAPYSGTPKTFGFQVKYTYSELSKILSGNWIDIKSVTP